MAESEVVEAEVVPDSTEIVRAQAAPVSIVPEATPDDLVRRMDLIEEAMRKAMKPNIDYGVIPGTGSKPTLLKPGAEKLCVLFRFDPQTAHEEHWDGDHLTVSARCVIYSQLDGTRLGSGEAMCSTREKKYAVRKQERTCPHCGEPAVIKGKEEYGGGWLCWKKKGGCSAHWRDGDPAIESQQAGEAENPDLPDTWNTVIKIARKRALVDAVLLASGASALFTQDLEDHQPPNPPGGQTAPGETPSTKAPIPSPAAPAGASSQGARGPEPSAATHQPLVVLVGEEQVAELRKCASGLTPQKIRLCFGAVGLGATAEGPINKETLASMLREVPQARAAALAQKLSEAER